MQEILDQILIYLKGLWLKKHYVVLAAWLVCPVGWYIVWTMPDQYESSARFHVDTQSLLKPLLRGLTVQNNSDQEIRLMVKTLFSRPNLEKIARDADLDLTTKTSQEYEVMISNLKDELKIASAGRENLFTISYTSHNPDLAKNVIQSTLNVLIENTLGKNRTNTDTVQSFLDEQISDYEKRLLDAEQKLTQFKQANVDVLKGNVGNYYSSLQSEKERLEGAKLQLNEAKTRLESARAQLKGEEPSFGLFAPPTAVNQKYSTEFDARISSLKQQLDQLLLRFTDRHPEVKELQYRITLLEEQRDEQIKVLQAQEAANAAQTQGLDNNPVYQEMKLNVSRLETEVASLEVRVKNFQNRVRELEEKVHMVPEAEAQLVALTRGYDITKAKYDELLTRREQARLSQKADLTADDIQFKVIDPPRKPFEPAGPNRPLFFSIITVFGIAAGIGLAFIMSQLRPVVFVASQLPDYPIFGMVQQLPSRQSRTLISFSKSIYFPVLMLLLLSAYGAIMAINVTGILQ